ncbi:MAG: hypothetical protein GX336_04235 [Halanaerobiaceae bacterium]|nr:hypothetical protein [Halanaerobiaceae bacterium]
MKIDLSMDKNYYRFLMNDNDLDKLKDRNTVGNTAMSQSEVEDEKIKLLANEFASIFMNQMFKAMRATIPEGGLIDGGFAEEVFTDMLDNEISKQGVGQDGFNTIGRLLYQQLKRRE